MHNKILKALYFILFCDNMNRFCTNIKKWFQKVYSGEKSEHFDHGTIRQGRVSYCRLHIKRRNFEYTNVDCWPPRDY